MDAEILLWIQENIRNDVLTPVMKWITSLGNKGIVWIIIGMIFLCIPKFRKAGTGIALALLGSLLLNNLFLKNAVGRIRPYEVIDGLELLVHKAVDASFPSGHSACSFASATVIFLLLPKKYGIPALILAALISFSRLYVGIHYPTDVLFGILDGICLGVGAVFLLKKFGNKLPWLREEEATQED